MKSSRGFQRLKNLFNEFIIIIPTLNLVLFEHYSWLVEANRHTNCLETKRQIK